MDSLFTHPTTKDLVLCALQQWIATGHVQSPFIQDPLFQVAFLDQQTIGWDDFFLGIGAFK